MSMRDVYEYAEEFVVMRDNRNMNVDWVEGVQGRWDKAKYYEANVEEGGRVVVALRMGVVGRSAVVLAEKLVDGYRYVAGSMEEWSNSNSISANLSPGKHILFIKT